MDLADEKETGESLSLALSPYPTHEVHPGASTFMWGGNDDDFSLGSADFDKPASEHSSHDQKSVEELLECFFGSCGG